MAAPLDVKPVFKMRGEREIACCTIVKNTKSSKLACQAESNQRIALTAITSIAMETQTGHDEGHNGTASRIIVNKTTLCNPHIRSRATNESR